MKINLSLSNYINKKFDLSFLIRFRRKRFHEFVFIWKKKKIL